MRKEITYYASDEKAFDNLNECVDYEVAKGLTSLPEIYDHKGKETDDVRKSIFVRFKDRAEVELFMLMLERAHYKTDGLETAGQGLYKWCGDDEVNRWIHLPDFLSVALWI